MKKRIWELDAFRGLCVLGMVAVHFIYDLVELYGIVNWQYPAWFAFVKDWGGVLFLLISGICATLGSRSVRRGIIVFLCGMVVTGVTYGMYRFGFDKSILIYFGVLQCLGSCMILWALLKRLPTWALAVLGVAMVAFGMYLDTQVLVQTKWLMPLGFVYRGFVSSDYFPLFPNLGFFLLGSVLGRTAYRNKESLLPRVNEKLFPLNFLNFCGRHSLLIYLAHQPVLAGLCMLLAELKRG